MNQEDLLYALALQKAKGIGDINAKKLIAHCGSPKNIFLDKPSVLDKINGIGSGTLRYLFDVKNLIEAEKELQYIVRNDIEVFYFLDDHYPERLKHCIDGPVLFFKKGSISLNEDRFISIVGTRNMTSYGKIICEKIVSEIADYHPVIISGYAYGVDICAHKAALKNNLETIAVLAHGFDEIYPKVHAKYQAKIYEQGAFISEFWHSDEMIKENFLKRNRIVAGMSQVTIVIESAEKGGSLVTADIANSYNRDVFAVPGRVNDPFSVGCNSLIKSHKAAILTSGKDLIELLGWETSEKKPASVQKQLFVDLNDDEKVIHKFLTNEGRNPADSIAMNCNFTMQQTNAILFDLELKGVVRTLPGRMYEVF